MGVTGWQALGVDRSRGSRAYFGGPSSGVCVHR